MRREMLVLIGLLAVAGPGLAQTDALAGGSDFWEVQGLTGDSRLNLRAAPATTAEVLGTFGNGEVLGNLGCRMTDEVRWCEVVPKADPQKGGWVAGQFLREWVPVGQDGTGEIDCVPAAGAAAARCPYAVQRLGGGSATVTVTMPNGTQRVLSFIDGTATGANGPFVATREGDVTVVTVGGERFEIPDAVIHG